MQDNEIPNEIGQASSQPQQFPPPMPNSQTQTPITSQNPPESPTKPIPELPKKNNKLYLILGIMLVALIVIFVVISGNQTKNNQSQTSILVRTVPQNLSALLSVIPLSSNMSDYYIYTSNTSTVNQYGLPFTRNLIESSTLPSNYTLEIPPKDANISSPIMVFITTMIYPNQTEARANYSHILNNITSFSKTYTEGPVNNSILYHANIFGLSLIGVALTYENTTSILLTWGNPNTFNDSSYVSNMAIKQYSIIRNK